MTISTAYEARMDALERLPRAIAYIDRMLAGPLDNEEDIRKQAVQLGYNLIRVMVCSTSDVDDPLARLLDRARAYKASAVVVSNLDHVAGDSARICEVCDLETLNPRARYVYVHTSVGDSSRVKTAMSARMEETILKTFMRRS
ncbi:trehalose-6-phosphate synthase [Nocardia sp. GAS34]|uniref:hypothetical protein n=1 Tax=unclassified Nocardia TaxID=2637762 RepID=UPI003D24AADA